MAGKIRIFITFQLALCMTFLFCVTALAAVEPQFRLDTDSLNFQKGVGSNIVLTLKNARGAEVISIEGLENFDIISQSQGSSTSIVGGNSSYEEYLYYTVMPKTAGRFTLKASVKYEDRTYETNSLEITVGESSSGQGEAAQNLFVNTVISHTEAYLGEKVVVTYELYSRYDIENFGFMDYTAIDGVIAKDMPSDQLKAESVYVDGVRYAKYEAKKLVLDSIRSGTHTIPSFNLQVNVITDNDFGGIFGGGFGGIFSRSQPLYLQTEEKELTVKPLPSEGKPKDFSGIVGELTLSGVYSREEVNYGESLSLLVTASGNCNLDGFKNIFAGEVSGFSVYETQKNTAESVENNQYHIQKEFEAILVPEQTGVLNLDPVSISYFNPVSGKYEKAEIPEVSIEVLGDIPQLNGDNQFSGVETVRIDQINYANTDMDKNYFTITVNKQVAYGILLGGVVLLILASVLARLVLKRRKQDPTMRSIYRQIINSQDINEVYSLFSAMINHSYKLSLKASSKNTVLNSVPDACLAEHIAGVMDYMESSEEKKCADLKNKIKEVYRMIASKRQYLP